jgi:hypothetical protein
MKAVSLHKIKCLKSFVLIQTFRLMDAITPLIKPKIIAKIGAANRTLPGRKFNKFSAFANTRISGAM